jgi:hypothetical protein
VNKPAGVRTRKRQAVRPPPLLRTTNTHVSDPENAPGVLPASPPSE